MSYTLFEFDEKLLDRNHYSVRTSFEPKIGYSHKPTP